RRLSEASAIVFVLLCCIPAGLTEELQPVQPIPLAVQNGCCECVLPTPQADSKYLLILGSLSRDAGPHRVLLQTRAAGNLPVFLPLEKEAPDDAWTRRVQALHDRLAKARRDREPTPACAPANEPRRQRPF